MVAGEKNMGFGVKFRFKFQLLCEVVLRPYARWLTSLGFCFFICNGGI